MKKIKKLLFVILLSIFPAFTFAQSAGDLYNAGISLMAKKDYDGAIKSFNASMTINKSEDNVKKCTTKINECKWYKSQVNPPRKETPKEPDPVVIPASLKVSSNDILVTCQGLTEDGHLPIISVSASPQANEWSVEPEDGNWFTVIHSNDQNLFSLKIKENNSDSMRESIITVKSGDLEEKISIKQEKLITIKAHYEKEKQGSKAKQIIDDIGGWFKSEDSDQDIINVSKKGESGVCIIACNSERRYDNGANWRVVELPEWCSQRKVKSNGKDAEPNELVLAFGELDKKKDGPYRNGDIKIESQGIVKVIRVVQK